MGTVGIYKITSPNGSVYIGQSWDIESRRAGYINARCPRQKLLHNSFTKYGWKTHTHEIVYVLPIDITQDVLDAYEHFFWKQFKEAGFRILNLREPGARGKHTEETKIKMKIAQKKAAIMKGRKWMSKNNASKFVPEHLIEEYLNAGWSIGRIVNYDSLSRAKCRNTSAIGRIWICKGNIGKMIYPSELINYPDWKRGSNNKNKITVNPI